MFTPGEGRHHHQQQQQRGKTPSFSSSLLDAIYRSIDESDCVVEHEETETTTVRMKQTNVVTSSQRQNGYLEAEDDIPCLRRRAAIMVDEWMETYSSSSAINSNSSSSTDSSCGGTFSSSSETESAYRFTPKSTTFHSSEAEFAYRSTPKSANYCAVQNQWHNTPPVFTPDKCKSKSKSKTAFQFEQIMPKKRDGRFMRTNSRAMKTYGDCDLKKAKQPLSPGSRIASFLNSIFSAKKSRINDHDDIEDWRSCSLRKSRSVRDSSSTVVTTTTCLSATKIDSQFSKSSCLSKTQNTNSSSSSNKSKRSVRFFPVVSVIVDEDCRPCGHKTIYQDDDPRSPTPIAQKHAAESVMLKNQFNNRHGVTHNFRPKNSNAFGYRNFHVVDDIDDEGDEDGGSCSSSDLFELESIGAYREELPVYGTTSLNKNSPHY